MSEEQNELVRLFEEAKDLFKRGNHFGALDKVETIVKHYPDFLPALGMLGDLYLQVGSPVLAIDPLEKVVEEIPNHVYAQFLLGCALGRMGRFERAIEHLHIADKLQPNDYEILRNLGWMTCMMEKVQEGRELLHKSIELNPKHALAYNDLGASYLFTTHRNLVEARKWLQRALEIEPDNQFIQNTWRTFQDMTRNIQ